MVDPLKEVRRQEPPNCIKFGMTEGCQLSCDFCGLQSIRSRPGGYKFMTLETASMVAAKLAAANWNSRIEIGLFGEETANPDFVEIIGKLRAALPKNYIILMSNGLGFVKSPAVTVRAVLEAGVDVLCLDQYDQANIVPKIRNRLITDESFLSWSRDNKVKLYEYPAEDAGNPHRRVRGVKRVTFTAPPNQSSKGTHSFLHNYAGLGGPPTDQGVGRRCAKPFRELAIRWDGKVPLCCMDWRGEIRLGDLLTESLEEVWQSSLLNAARKKLYRGERTFGPCEGCGARSYRVGLLPDRMGKETLPPATTAENEILAAASASPSMTPAVPLPWEDQLPERRRIHTPGD